MSTVTAAPAGGGGITGWATDLMAALGAPGAGVVVALENVFPPIPSEIILPLAGFAAGRGEFSVLSAILWTTGGSVVGAVALYLVGMLAPEHRVRKALATLPMVHVEDVARAESWFDRHGRSAVFLGRMVPGVRSLVSIPAGARRMPWWEFVLFTGAGSLIWNTVFVAGGYALGDGRAVRRPVPDGRDRRPRRARECHADPPLPQEAPSEASPHPGHRASRVLRSSASARPTR
jgi:membrane protein DedA with SNARE-associated domain